jgi:hypothetical protein
MVLFDNALKSLGSLWVQKVLVGVGVALVAPVIVPTLAVGLRSLVKTALKGGMIMYDKSQEIVAEAGEQNFTPYISSFCQKPTSSDGVRKPPVFYTLEKPCDITLCVIVNDCEQHGMFASSEQ